MKAKVVKDEKRGYTWCICDDSGKEVYNRNKWCPTEVAAVRSMQRGAKKAMAKLAKAK